MTLRKAALVPLLTALALAPSGATYAGQDDCAIWICLPAGFGITGCGDARRAFLKRIRRLKSPLPNILSCFSADAPTPDGPPRPILQSGILWSYDEMQCADTDNPAPTGRSLFGGAQQCRFPIYKNPVISAGHCGWSEHDDRYHRSPEGCLGNVKTVQVEIDGDAYGDVYSYWYYMQRRPERDESDRDNFN